jgi:hypothetical protein
MGGSSGTPTCLRACLQRKTGRQVGRFQCHQRARWCAAFLRKLGSSRLAFGNPQPDLDRDRRQGHHLVADQEPDLTALANAAVIALRKYYARRPNESRSTPRI